MLTGDEERVHSNTSNGSGRSAMNNPDRELGQELLGPVDGEEKIEWDPFFGPPVRKGEVPPGPKPWENDKGKSVAGLRVNAQEIAAHQQKMAIQAEQLGRQRGMSMRNGGAAPSVGGQPAAAAYSARPPPGPPLGPAGSKSVGGGYQPPQIGAGVGGGVSGGYHASPQQYAQNAPPMATTQPAGQYQPVAGTGVAPPNHATAHQQQQQQILAGQQDNMLMGGGLMTPQQQQQQTVFAKLTFRDGWSAPYIAPFQVQFGEWVIVSGQREGEVANVAAVTTVPPPVQPGGQIQRKASPEEVAAAKAAPPPAATGAPARAQQATPSVAPVFFAKVKPIDGPAIPVLVGKHKVQPGDKVCVSCFTPDDECLVEAVTTVAPPGVKVTAKIVEVLKPELLVPGAKQANSENGSVEALGLDSPRVESSISTGEPATASPADQNRAVRQSSAMSL